MVTKSAVSAKSGELVTKQSVTVTINGRKFKFSVGDAIGEISPSETLLETLRTKLQMTGAKSSCQVGACGCCAVIVNGDAVAACMTLTIEMDGKNIVTVEGLEDAQKGLDPLQQAFIDEYSFQCGYCTPGIIMVAKALFQKNEHPSPEQIKEALAGNYCRCISHYTVLRALNKVAGNNDAELSNFVRANDLVEDPIPVTEEVYPSPYAYGHASKHSVD